VEHLAEQLAAVPGVVAVALGGSRARGEATEASDWDFGLYYRGEIAADDVRALGFEGTVVEPGAWGRLVNGGAWLTVDGQRVDLLYRDLDAVERWVAKAERGRYEVDLVEGYVAGMATYVLAGELALGKTLVGDLPRPEFPGALRRSAPQRWLATAEFSLAVAQKWAERADVVACSGLLAKAAIAAAQGRLAERGEWALNERAIVRRADLLQAEGILTAVGSRPFDLYQAIVRMAIALGVPRPGA
jgi:hypothetical protein